MSTVRQREGRMREQKVAKPRTAVGAPWSGAVVCPRCGGAAEEIPGRRRMPRWRCRSPECVFRLGWRLRPAADGELRAVPMGSDGQADDRHPGAPWPPTHEFRTPVSVEEIVGATTYGDALAQELNA